ncbi:MAG: hypothetical protein JST70_05390 [Bacteroidetes bacterium]|nr:hypothetical protein [Bacteroidota bacterium]
MRKKLLIMVVTLAVCKSVTAQHSTGATYAKFLELTSMFHGTAPYSCEAIVGVSYKSGGKNVRDTSKLIYKNGSTFYKSRLVEHVEASQGELIVNHELKTVTFNISDSIRQVLEKEVKLKQNVELESLLDSNFERNDREAFNKYVMKDCNVTWDSKGELEEISIVPKNLRDAMLMSMKIRFNKDSKVVYYEYTNKEAYAKDLDGNTRYRILTTIYDKFAYNNIPDIPSRLSDFLEWDGWTVKLKKYSNYKFSLL